MKGNERTPQTNDAELQEVKKAIRIGMPGWLAKVGLHRYWDGVDVGDNPHEDDMDEYRLWEEGWRLVRKHDYDESEG